MWTSLWGKPVPVTCQWMSQTVASSSSEREERRRWQRRGTTTKKTPQTPPRSCSWHDTVCWCVLEALVALAPRQSSVERGRFFFFFVLRRKQMRIISPWYFLLTVPLQGLLLCVWCVCVCVCLLTTTLSLFQIFPRPTIWPAVNVKCLTDVTKNRLNGINDCALECKHVGLFSDTLTAESSCVFSCHVEQLFNLPEIFSLSPLGFLSWHLWGPTATPWLTFDLFLSGAPEPLFFLSLCWIFVCWQNLIHVGRLCLPKKRHP